MGDPYDARDAERQAAEQEPPQDSGDPDCPACHGKGYITEPGEAGIVHGKRRACGHCYPESMEDDE